MKIIIFLQLPLIYLILFKVWLWWCYIHHPSRWWSLLSKLYILLLISVLYTSICMSARHGWLMNILDLILTYNLLCFFNRIHCLWEQFHKTSYLLQVLLFLSIVTIIPLCLRYTLLYFLSCAQLYLMQIV